MAPTCPPLLLTGFLQARHVGLKPDLHFSADHWYKFQTEWRHSSRRKLIQTLPVRSNRNYYTSIVAGRAYFYSAMLGFLNSDYRVNHAFHHVPISLFMGFVAKHAAWKTKDRLYFLHLGIKQCTLTKRRSIGVKSDVTFLAITGGFHCAPVTINLCWQVTQRAAKGQMLYLPLPH